MLKSRIPAALLVGLQALVVPYACAFAAESVDEELTEIRVSAQRVANTRPAGTYASVVTTLRFDPLTELQSRGIAEGQSDVTVRGGVFENTGFKLGAVTVMDPQTGHYAAELPVDPALLSAPAILQGIDGAIEGFNAAIATVSYAFAPVASGGEVAVGFGNDNLDYQTLRVGHETNDGLALAVSAARSAGDGTLPYGDHAFARYNIQLQWLREAVRTDVLLAYQDKFFGWPGAYTGFASLPETDDTQTTLILFNQRRETDDGWFEYGAYHRRLEDDYDFNRLDVETGTPGAFEHETRVSAIGFQGLQNTGRIAWRYGGQLSRDELVRSTDLTNGTFNDRSYATLSLVPSIEVALASGSVLTWRAGITGDYSNRDGSRVSPLAGLSLEQAGASGTTTWALEYAATTQLPGYTALNSNPGGLFGGNPLLGREIARQLTASVAQEQARWQLRAAVFARRDDGLVDWTYAIDAPFARQANPVDLDVLGLEAFLARAWDNVDIALGFTWLDKDSDYGDAQVDASYYALNFARQRATLAIRYRFAGGFELRVDTEYRRQEDNPLRVGDDDAFLASAALEWRGAPRGPWRLALLADNLTDSEYQPFPGTPAYGRQYSLNVTYAW